MSSEPAPSPLTTALREFVAERDWAQFHSPENLAKSVSIEAAELLECFQWNADGDVERVKTELADVLTYIRNAWSNRAPPVSAELVQKQRELDKNRAGRPWTAKELTKSR